LDLITELGASTTADVNSPDTRVAVGILGEAADILMRVAANIETSGWSLCPCGDDHGQSSMDADVATTLRKDADLVRQLRALEDR
jgi:hypothetical protein